MSPVVCVSRVPALMASICPRPRGKAANCCGSSFWFAQPYPSNFAIASLLIAGRQSMFLPSERPTPPAANVAAAVRPPHEAVQCGPQILRSASLLARLIALHEKWLCLLEVGVGGDGDLKVAGVVGADPVNIAGEAVH